jgi:hypothetical protein
VIDLLDLPNNDVQILTAGKLNFYLKIRDPYKMYRVHRDQRLKKLKNIPAVYFLFHERKLVYIGKCAALKDRIQDHIRGREHLNGYWPSDGTAYRHDRKIPPKEFDTISKLYVSLSTAELVEPIYIAHYRPVLNKMGVDKPHNQLSIYDGQTTINQY